MQRTDHVTRALDLFGTGKDGYQEGDAEQQVPGTVVTAAALNAMQEELARAVEQYVPLDPANSGQLATCLAKELPAKLCTTPEFLDKVYSWENAHGFRSSIGVYGNVVLGPASTVLYANAFGVVTPRLRQLQVPMSSFLADNGAWRCGGGPAGNESLRWWKVAGVPGNLKAELLLPDNAKPWKLRVSVVVTGGPMTVGIGRYTSTLFGNEVSEITAEQVGQASLGTTGIHDIALDAEPFAWHGGFGTLGIDFAAPDLSAVCWLKVIYADPGPKNLGTLY